MGSRMNAGYLITDSIHIGTTEFVLGVSIAERSMFVTWACQGSDYYYGRVSDKGNGKKARCNRRTESKGYAPLGWKDE